MSLIKLAGTKLPPFLLIIFLIVFASPALGEEYGEILSAETRSAEIAPLGEVDTYTFYGNAGDGVVIKLFMGSYATVVLLDPDGISEISADSSIFNTATIANHQLAKTGVYTIVCYNSYNTGGYNLSFLKIPGATVSPSDGDGGDIASAETLSGQMSPAGDTDAYTFYGDTGDSVIIGMYMGHDSEIALYDPDGILEVFNNSGIFNTATIANHQLAKTGVYTIVCYNTYPLSGSYNLSFLKIPGATVSPSDGDGGGIASAETLSGQMSPAGDTDAYTFYGSTGDSVTISMDMDHDSEIALNDPDGILEVYSNSGIFNTATIANHQLAKTGVYTIICYNLYPLTGGYNLSLIKDPPALPPGLYNPVPENGSIVSVSTGLLEWDDTVGATHYDVYFGLGVRDALVLIAQDITISEAAMPAIVPQTTYYWKVIAKTASGDIQGPVWMFSTELGAASVTVTSPNGGETWSAGGTETVTWTSTGTVASVDIDLSTDGGSSWTNLINDSADDGTETVIVPGTISTTCLIRVREGASGAPFDESNEVFIIGQFTEVCGSIHGEVIWTAASSPYVVTCPVTIEPYETAGFWHNSTLTIEAGVVVKFMPETYLQETTGTYKGSLIVQGTAMSPVHFTSIKDDSAGGDTNGDGSLTSPAAGDWGYVLILNSSTYIHHCIIKYAGGVGEGIYGALKIQDSSPTVSENLIFQNHLGLGIQNGSPSLSNNTIENSTYLPIFLGGSSFPSYSGNTYANNGKQAIRISGTISSSGTWNKEVVPYYMGTAGTEVNISADAIVTVAPGTIFKFGTSTNLNASGILNLQGTAGNPVYFTSLKDDSVGGDTEGDGASTRPAAGDWGYVKILNSSNDIHDCVFKYGGNYSGSYYGALYVQSSSPTISGNHFIQNWRGIYIENGSPALTNNAFEDSTWVPIHLYESSFPTYSGNTYNDNELSIGIDGTVSFSGTWHKEVVPYWIWSGVNISSGSTVAVSRGTIFKFGPSAILNVAGVLDLQGTNAEPVNFTSYRDDTIGGDSNGDGSGTSPAAGDWGCVRILNSGNMIHDCVFKYGGNVSGSLYGALHIQSSSSAILECRFVQNIRGVYCDASSSSLQNSHFSSNAYGIYVNSGSPRINYCSIEDNSSYGVYNNGGIEINAENCWWGDASGPTHSSNPSGTGDQVSDMVDFMPFSGNENFITVISPNGGETWTAGSTYIVTWAQAGVTGSVTIDLYRGGVYQRTLGTADATVGGFDWAVAIGETPGTDYRVLVWQESVSDESDADFTIVQVAGPKKADFNGDGQEDILWRYYGEGGYNRVWFLGDSGAAGLPMFTNDPRMEIGAAGRLSSAARAWMMTASDPREIGVVSKRNEASRTDLLLEVMGPEKDFGRELATINDPRKAGGGHFIPSPISIADPRDLKLAMNPGHASDAPVEIAAAPIWLGGADIMPVDDVNWQIVGTGDFDNDTHADILWRNISTGTNVIWLMNGTEWSSSVEILPVGDQTWQIVGTGDFDKDTHVDILWRNSVSGANVIWYMDGTTWTGSAVLLGVSDPTWQIVGTGDFNKDGNVDILWRNNMSGSNVVWYMNNAAWAGSAELILVGDTAWQIMGTGDYDSDGNIDILWRYNGAGGYNVIWYMNGVTWSSSAELLPVPDLIWRIVSR